MLPVTCSGHTVVMSQPSSYALTTGFHFSCQRRRGQSSNNILHRCKCAQGMPHTGGMALVFVPAAWVQSFIQSTSTKHQQCSKPWDTCQPFPCLPLCGCRAHTYALLPVSDLTLELDFPKLHSTAGTFTSPCLCTCCSLYMQCPLLGQSSTLSTTHCGQYLP